MEKKLRVLVIEDDKEVSNFVCDVLGSLNCDIAHSVDSLEEAEDILDNIKLDIVVSDGYINTAPFTPPKVFSIPAIRKAKARGLPVLLMSGKINGNSKKGFRVYDGQMEAIQDEPDYLIEKPFRISDFEEALNYIKGTYNL